MACSCRQRRVFVGADPVSGTIASLPPGDFRVATADAVPALISFFDADHICRFANDHHIQWYDREPSTITGHHMRDLLGEEIYQARQGYLAQVARGESVSFVGEVAHGSGTPREAAIRYVARMGPGGFEGFHVLIFDLSREQQRFHSVFDGTAVGFVEIDLSNVRGLVVELEEQFDDISAPIAQDLSIVRRALDETRVIGLNEKASQMLRVERAEAIGRPLGDWCPEISLEVWNRVFLRYLAGAVSHEEETVLRDTAGAPLEVILSAVFPKRPEEQVQVVVGLVDVSERVAKEHALARAQLDLAHASRVATLGELVASIAHEVNQPLAAVVTNGNAALRWLNRAMPDVEEAKTAIRRMMRDGERASEIIARTRRMSMKGNGEHGAFDLHDMIGEALDITRRQVTALGATLSSDTDHGRVAMIGDRVQLQQVIINLIINAAQAMSNQPEGTRRIQLKTLLEQEDVLIAVADTGPGLPVEEAPRIFDAFFTTKPDGMGMGLSISKSIVEAHGGRIEALPRPGGGTLFHVRMPAVADHPAGLS